ncbi:MAG: FecR domain-containing protein [Cyclobacteriaceae bacterium]|jgi:ferric-dicitrate binding protein FerR (iron transport regulator)|nr:FecR domain-containing protein [Cyclobacteriaceae bacterium]
MVAHTDSIDDLIGQVLTREASAAEEEALRAWRQLDPANETYFRQCETVFQHAADEKQLAMFDQERAWQKVKARIKPSARRVAFPWPYRLAAGVALIAGVSYFWRSQKPTPVVEWVATSQVRSDTLPDGTTASLNKASQLEYTFDARQNLRTVKLQGEAFFHVKHEAEKAFVIQADEVFIRDIGTQFNVTSFADRETIEVMVTEGEVLFYSAHNPGIQLVAGETGIYHKPTQTFAKKEQTDTNRLAYTTRVFRFSNAPVAEVIARVNEVYGARLALAHDTIGLCTVTVGFDRETPQTIAEIIAETLGLTVTEKDGLFVLSGKGCPPAE